MFVFNFPLIFSSSIFWPAKCPLKTSCIGQRTLFSVFQVVPNTSIWLFVIQLKRVKRDQKRIESKIGFQNKTELVENGEQSNAFQLAVDVC